MPQHLVLVALERFSSSATNEPRLTREPVIDSDSGIDLDLLGDTGDQRPDSEPIDQILLAENWAFADFSAPHNRARTGF